MNKISVKTTHPSDFTKIYPLLKEFNSPYTEEDWNRIFTYRWEGVEDFVGFHLERNGLVIGFMGLIFSCRYKQNQKYKFCNITSLIVKEEYRNATLLLMRKLKDFKETIFIVLNPVQASSFLFIKLGFVAYEAGYKIIPTLNHLLGRKCKRKIYELPELLNKVDTENKRILNDHTRLKCKSMLVDFDGMHCLLIYKILEQNYYKVPIKKVQILYISNIEIFNQNLYTILNIFKMRFGVLSAIYLGNRFIHHKKLLLSFTKIIASKVLCSNPYKNLLELDELYSESVLL